MTTNVFYDATKWQTFTTDKLVGTSNRYNMACYVCSVDAEYAYNRINACGCENKELIKSRQSEKKNICFDHDYMVHCCM